MAIKKLINDKVVYQLSINLEEKHWQYVQAFAVSKFGTDQYSISATIRAIIEENWNERSKREKLSKDA